MAARFARSSADGFRRRPFDRRRPTDGPLKIQEGATMSFDVARPTGATVSHLTPRPRPEGPVEEGGFAKVYDLAKARRGAPELPAALWDEVDRAAAIAADLEATGRSIRFSDPDEGGRVRVELIDAAGNVIKPISLGEIVSIGSTDPPTAA
jgi:hypothetical protein